jgi:hypothetical protein
MPVVVSSSWELNRKLPPLHPRTVFFRDTASAMLPALSVLNHKPLAITGTVANHRQDACLQYIEN